MLKSSRRSFMTLAASSLAAPAIAQSAPRTIRMVTSWPGSLSGLGDSVKRTAKSITALSGGSLSVEVYPAGTLVPPLGVHDAVSAGDAEMYHSADYYFQGKHRGFNFFSTVPLGLTSSELFTWVNHGGGQALWDELNAQYGVRSILAGSTGTQMGGWFVEPITSVDDLKKTIMRIPGLGGQALNALGVETVVLPGGAIVAALTNGEIGATEWVGPWNDLQFGFQKLLSTYVYPGFHEPGAGVALGTNLDLWNDLTDKERAVIETVARSECTVHTAHFYANNAFSLRKVLDVYGVQATRLSDDVFDIIADAALSTVAGVANDDDLARRIYESYAGFRDKVMQNTQTSNEFAFMADRRSAYQFK